MEEQSHKDEMRAALRGDFERMRQRQSGETERPAQATAVAVQNESVGQAEVPQGSWLDRILGRA